MCVPLVISGNLMRRVSIRRFQRKIYEEIKDLPVLVVKKDNRYDTQGTPLFVVQKPNDQDDFLTSIIGDE